MQLAATIVALVVATLYLLHGGMILRSHEMQNAVTIHWPWERYRLVAILELAAGIGLIVGIFYRPLGVAAAFGLMLLMIGAAILRARAGDAAKNIIGDAVLAAIAAVTGILQILAG